MLVLSRKLNETVICGEGDNRVIITVVEIRGDKVRLGFSALPTTPIHRAEVWEAIQRDMQKTERK